MSIAQGVQPVRAVRRLGKAVLARYGYTVLRSSDRLEIDDFTGLEAGFVALCQRCRYQTMTTVSRMYALYSAVRYVVENEIPGDFVECGVWKGGSSMLIALTLLELGCTDRKLYLYDTYAGMSEPTDRDRNIVGTDPSEAWSRAQGSHYNEWMYAPLQEVRRNMLSTGYPQQNVVFVQGKVEDTIPGIIPERVALLRLDTDWYESTYHELQHLYPRLTPQGVLLLDDYGFWQGAKEATDRYFQEHNVRMLLNRIDFTGRIGVKST